MEFIMTTTQLRHDYSVNAECKFVQPVLFVAGVTTLDTVNNKWVFVPAQEVVSYKVNPYTNKYSGLHYGDFATDLSKPENVAQLGLTNAEEVAKLVANVTTVLAGGVEQANTGTCYQTCRIYRAAVGAKGLHPAGKLDETQYEVLPQLVNKVRDTFKTQYGVNTASDNPAEVAKGRPQRRRLSMAVSVLPCYINDNGQWVQAHNAKLKLNGSAINLCTPDYQSMTEFERQVRTHIEEYFTVQNNGLYGGDLAYYLWTKTGKSFVLIPSRHVPTREELLAAQQAATQQAKPVETAPAPVTEAKPVDTNLATVDKLQVENAELRNKVAKLEAELAELRKQLQPEPQPAPAVEVTEHVVEEVKVEKSKEQLTLEAMAKFL